MKILLVPIEPIELRYSIQWKLWFENYFDSQNVDYIVIDPLKENPNLLKSSTKVSVGQFLDVYNTNIYKAAQLQMICNWLSENRDNDEVVVFFMDLWFPGLEMIRYISCGAKRTIKIAGCLHAGSYDSNDFLFKAGMKPWAKFSEKSWLILADRIFVATKYHKALILKRRAETCFDETKIYVSGFPIFPPYEKIIRFSTEKERIIVFPHRLAQEKNYELAMTTVTEILKRHKLDEWSFVASAICCNTKSEYYDLLLKSAISVSFAVQETWGIAMQESVFCGTYPLVPERLSYREMYPTDFRYSQKTFEEKLLTLISKFESGNVESEAKAQMCLAYRLAAAGKNSIENMLYSIEGDFR